MVVQRERPVDAHAEPTLPPVHPEGRRELVVPLDVGDDVFAAAVVVFVAFSVSCVSAIVAAPDVATSVKQH